MNDNNKWDSHYDNKIGLQWSPSEDIVRFCARHLKTRIGANEFVDRTNFKHVLDLGCGNGRHVIFFARQGFSVTGVDISEKSLEICNDWLREEGLQASIKQADVKSIPFDDNSFDIVVSFGVLDHVLIDTAFQTAKEIKRLLNINGYLHINLRHPDSFDYGLGEKIENGTFKLTEGPEKGIPQHFWTEKEIDKLLDGFEILNWELLTRYLCKDKSLRDSRWAISARLK